MTVLCLEDPTILTNPPAWAQIARADPHPQSTARALVPGRHPLRAVEHEATGGATSTGPTREHDHDR